jgi:hypothetical protein
MLTLEEARVLGALVEKERTTPEYYPLTLNALLAACNQKNNRDPVMQLDETAVDLALDGLRGKKLAWEVTLVGGRATKYRHAFGNVYPVAPDAVPLLVELLPRGPQTAAELRMRAERMQPHPYQDVAAVEKLLEQLAADASWPFVARLPREPGKREPRWAQLLGGPVADAPTPATNDAASAAPIYSPAASRLDRLEQEVAALKTQVEELQTRFEALARELGQ